MSNLCRGLLLPLLRRPFHLNRALFSPCLTQVNHLYTNEFLGLDAFLQNRDRIIGQFGPMRDKFFERMTANLAPSEDGKDKLVFTEDLKNVVFLMKDSDEEIALLKDMVAKFNGQNKDLRFGSFIFGPVVMRLLHTFKKPDVALELVNDPSCEGFFHQLTTYTILTDLLLTTKRYHEIIELYDTIEQKSIFDAKFPRDLMTSVMASAYLIGTKEVYDKMKDLVLRTRKEGGWLSSRAISFFSAMALKHNDPDPAFEALSVMQRLPALPRNLKILAVCKMNRPDDALLSLRSYLCDESFRKSDDLTKEAIDELTKSVQQTGNADLIRECEQIVRSLSEKNHVAVKTLEEMLMEPIRPIVRQKSLFEPTSNDFRRQSSRQGYNDSFRGGYNDGNRGYNYDNPNRSRFDVRQQRSNFTPMSQRRGLREME